MIKKRVLYNLILAAILSGCAPDFVETFQQTGLNGEELLEQQNQRASELTSFRSNLHYSSFYSLTEPNQSQCAGDQKIYFDSLKKVNGLPAPLEESLATPGASIKPSWVKNVSVDLTDSNAETPANLAFACSYGTGQGIPPTSACATFDFGAIEGIPTTLGGAMFLFGGVRFRNEPLESGTAGPTVSCGPLIDSLQLAGTPGEPNLNSCSNDLYALGIDALPATAATNPPSSIAPGLTSASEPISSYAKISSTNNYTGPNGTAGSHTVLSPVVKKILQFGGSQILDRQQPNAKDPGVDTRESWIFDLEKLQWEQLAASHNIEPQLKLLSECIVLGTQCPAPSQPNGCNSACIQNLSQPYPIGEHIGFVAGPGWSIDQLTQDGSGRVLNARIDTTDRIFILGGTQTSGQTTTVFQGPRKLNPTMGPELIDLEFDVPTQFGPSTPNDIPTQFADSYETQLLHNSTNGLYNEPVNNNGISNPGIALALSTATGKGQAIAFGGFIEGQKTTSGSLTNGQSQITNRSNPTSGLVQDFIGVPTLDKINNGNTSSQPSYRRGIALNPIRFADATQANVPDFGGMRLIRAFGLNNFITIGGSNCANYGRPGLNNNCSTTTTPAVFNPGSQHYSWNGTTPIAATAPNNTRYPAGGRAGMAAARGLDGAGNPIIIAFGGVGPTVGLASDTNLYYIWNNAGTPTWESINPPLSPSGRFDSAMVYSHVTGKFYLFGGQTTGINPSKLGDTWELTVTNACTGGSSCTFNWKQLDVNGGTTCYPACGRGPAARSGHSMTEVNYHNFNPALEYENCPAGQPCSFLMFMTGGVDANGTPLGDLFAFDPTANGGRGHWERFDSFPPRNSAAIAEVSFTTKITVQKKNYAVVYGGQTGLHNPEQAVSGNFYVPPTLADTNIFNFDTQTWHRMEIKGTGYHNFNPNVPEGRDETEMREAFSSNDSDPNRGLLHTLSPPPLAGTIAVTRTRSGPLLSGSVQSKKLAIPEMFVFGGRLKTGEYSTLDDVYKLCVGSVGENAFGDDGTCDAFDPITNPNSPFPSNKYIGRWLHRRPLGINGFDPSSTGSFYGAGAYDPLHDKILLVGGIGPNNGATHVTQSQGLQRIISTDIVEYTPPSRSLTAQTPNLTAAADLRALHGSFQSIGACNGSPVPVGRYGHQAHFDSTKNHLIVVGGYALDGTPLVQNYVDNGATTQLQTPEIWVARRNDSQNCYQWRQITTFGNELNAGQEQFPLEGLGNASSVLIQNNGFSSGFYTMQDQSCIGAGPIASPDPNINKQLAGGIDIDINRQELGPNENLLLTITLFPFGENNVKPTGENYGPSETADFRVHLMSVGLNESVIQETFQPRYITYASEENYPKIIDTLSILAPPTGQVVQKQILIPLYDPSINRIRIQRQRQGSGQLIDFTLDRMGYR